MIEKIKEIGNFKVIYKNEIAMQELFDSIFIQEIYNFYSKDPIINIIDAGSNIGMAALFFKSKYPLAKILCFEPDPYNFKVLQKNIYINNLNDIKIINAALAKQVGFIPFYGEIASNADTRGNSIIKVWGNQRETSKSINVPAVRLSSYIENKVDFLKMDIEGAEQQVLEELKDKLRLIKYLIIEVHETNNLHFENNLSIICEILKNHKFELEVQDISNLDFFPEPTIKWSKQVLPKLSIIKASNTLMRC